MKTKIAYFFKSYFGFSHRETRGFLFVVPVIFILYLTPHFLSFLQEKHHQKAYEDYFQQVDSLFVSGLNLVSSVPIKQTAQKDTVKAPSQLKKSRAVQFTKIDFNEADSVELQIVPGIGQTMAGRVVKFREFSGGLYAREQLLDVFGMTEETMEKIFEYFEFTPVIKNKILLNKADVNTLAKHPYITYGAAKVIVAYRDQHGPYQTASDLLRIKILNKDWLERLEPYLDLND
jgi:competence protein ComEA